jgi:hypothetical protein
MRKPRKPLLHHTDFVNKVRTRSCQINLQHIHTSYAYVSNYVTQESFFQCTYYKPILVCAALYMEYAVQFCNQK